MADQSRAATASAILKPNSSSINSSIIAFATSIATYAKYLHDFIDIYTRKTKKQKAQKGSPDNRSCTAQQQHKDFSTKLKVPFIKKLTNSMAVLSICTIFSFLSTSMLIQPLNHMLQTFHQILCKLQIKSWSNTSP